MSEITLDENALQLIRVFSPYCGDNVLHVNYKNNCVKTFNDDNEGLLKANEFIDYFKKNIGNPPRVLRTEILITEGKE